MPSTAAFRAAVFSYRPKNLRREIKHPLTGARFKLYPYVARELADKLDEDGLRKYSII